jgi:hypothetical protein
MIDKALEQIERTENKKEEPAIPATNPEIRFYDHMVNDLEPGLKYQKDFLCVIKYFDKNMKDQISLEPTTPPPKFLV